MVLLLELLLLRAHHVLHRRFIPSAIHLTLFSAATTATIATITVLVDVD